MVVEDQPSQAGAEARAALPWWDVRRPGTFHLYVGLCWSLTPIALTALRALLGQNLGVALLVVGVVWVVGHLALVYWVARLHLIQRTAGRVLFVAAVVLASAGAGGTVLMIFAPEILASGTLSMRDILLVAKFSALLVGALALLSLSARRSDLLPPTPHT